MLATVTAGPEPRAPSCSSRPDGTDARHARRPRPRPRRRARRARRARGRPHVDPALRRARRGARRHGVGVHRVVRAAAAHGDLRRGRLHRRAGEASPRCSATASSCATRARCSRRAQRFPMADEVVNEWPDRYLEKIGDELGPRDAVCVLTHDTKFDVPAIVGALATARRLPRRDGIAPDARQARRAAARGRRHRRRARPDPRADRSRHRRPHARRRPRCRSAPRSSRARTGRDARSRCATPTGPIHVESHD